jgi:Skp family chaperone for outer membrane proteins
MKRFFFPLVLLCSCAASSLYAASAMAPNAVAAQPAAVKIVPTYVIDMERCMRESAIGKEKSALIEKKEREITMRSEQMGNDLRQKTQELEQKGAMLSPDAVNKKRKEIERLRDDYETEFQQLRMEYEQLAGVISQEMNDFIVPIKKAVSDKLGGAAIADKRMYIEVGALPECTDLFIAEMDAVYKAQKAAKPAAPAAKA